MFGLKRKAGLCVSEWLYLKKLVQMSESLRCLDISGDCEKSTFAERAFV